MNPSPIASHSNMAATPPMPHPTHTLTIDTVAYGGRGVARLDGQVIFVPGTLPDETVEVTITARHARYSVARLDRVLTASPHRIAPACPLAADGSCAGCAYQHADYPTELQLKQDQFAQQLGTLDDAPPLLPPVGAPQPLGYRNKLVLHTFRKRGRFRLGYVGHDNHQIIDVPACPLASDAINAQLAAIRQDPAATKRLRHEERLTIRQTAADGVCFWPAPKSPTPLPEWLTEQTPYGTVQIPRKSFAQVNPAVAQRMLQEVTAIIAQTAPALVYDLYCGAGLFALAALHAGTSTVVGIDSDGLAITAARRNAVAHGFDTQATFHGCAMEEATDLLANVPDEHGNQLVIIDPPRSGIAPPVRDALIQLTPTGILYVSCAADTMARDARAFLDAGYRIVSTQLFDMFPRTRHFESVTHFTRA